MNNKTVQLNIFYEEPDNDRWFKYDKYPRKVIRTLLRKSQPIGGVRRWFLNLISGLDELGYPYRINDYKSLHKDSNQWALVIGKPHVIEKIPLSTNIIYGPGVASHPSDTPFLKERSNIKHILTSCEWLKNMYDRDLELNIPVSVWPSGIETEAWKPPVTKILTNSILIYDKIRWEHDYYKNELLRPIYSRLAKENINIHYIKYGDYKENDFKEILSEVDGMIFLCEHETQGFAYLQALSSNVPILAWDRGGYWQDPSLYPEKVLFEPVTSVPYWDENCGQKFKSSHDFETNFGIYWSRVIQKNYCPRKYILSNLSLTHRSQVYIEIIKTIIKKHQNKC